MTEVIDGIAQIKVPIPRNPLGFTNIYLLSGDDGYLLIDAGFGSDAALHAVTQQLAGINADIRKIKRVVITHSHNDHIGLAGAIRRQTGAKIALHVAEAMPRPASPDRKTVREREGWLMESGISENTTPGLLFRKGAPVIPVMPGPDETFEDGQVIDFGGVRLKAIWTPGHSPGHVCLYDAERKILFSADHVLPVTIPNIGLRPGSKGNPLGDYLRSLQTVRELDVELVLPGHENVFSDLRRRVDEIVEHHEFRNGEIMTVLRSGPKTVYQIAEEITWMRERGGVKFHDLSPWDQRLAISEALAHVNSLKEDGKINRYISNGIVYYFINT